MNDFDCPHDPSQMRMLDEAQPASCQWYRNGLLCLDTSVYICKCGRLTCLGHGPPQDKEKS